MLQLCKVGVAAAVMAGSWHAAADAAETSAATQSDTPTAIDTALYFQSDVRDADDCDLVIGDDNRFRFPDVVTNPASSCPDAWAWKLLFDGIQAEFWKNWAFDSYQFPKEPLPMCDGASPDEGACCDPQSLSNPGYDAANPGAHCPYFPGDHPDDLASATPPPTVADDGHSSINSEAGVGVILNQQSAEIILRNKPSFQYVFDNGLYSREGLSRRFKQAQDAAAQAAPYRKPNTTIEYPIGSIMFKTNWVHQDRMIELGLVQSTDADGEPLDPPQNKDAPYVTMVIDESLADNHAIQENFQPGLYYLVAMVNMSKDLPQWFWFAIEHVGNPGRCDFIGCNDSFGYRNAQAPDGALDNFTPPHQVADGFGQGGTVFDTGKPYDGGKLSASLAAIYDKLGMTVTNDPDPSTPSMTDAAWKSYRLKGTQTQFVTGEGFATHLGNSVSEADVVNTSSCISCHAQASVASDGSLGIASRGVRVQLNWQGSAESSLGPPDLSMFYDPGSTLFRVLRTDYAWGLQNANAEIDPKTVQASDK